MNTSLKGKTAVVCGSTQGIGLATANQLASMGARIILVARNEEKLKNALGQLPSNENHAYVSADFSKPTELKNKIEDWAKNNVAHILVNNTGGPKGGPIIDAAIDEFTAAFIQHLICNHIIVQGHDFRRSLFKSVFDAEICRRSPIEIPVTGQTPNLRKFSGKHFIRAIRRSIVYNNDLKVSKGLPFQRIQTIPRKINSVINRYNYIQHLFFHRDHSIFFQHLGCHLD